MGCGSSSLKGEKVDDLGAGAQPVRKVKTNFSDVDFSSDAPAARRGTMAVAPDETRRPTRVSEASVEGAPQAQEPVTNTKMEAQAEKARQGAPEGAELQPHKTLDGADDDLLSPNAQMPDPMQKKQESNLSPEIHVAQGQSSHDATDSAIVH